MLERLIKFGEKLAHRRTSSRLFQQELDTQEIYLVTSFHEKAMARKAKDPNWSAARLTRDEVMDMSNFERSETMSYAELKQETMKNLDNQVLGLMQHVIKTGGCNPYPTPVYKASAETCPKEERRKLLNLYLKTKLDLSNVQYFNPGISIPHPDGFRLQIRKSNIDHPESGYGVWIEGTALPGTLIGFYPGVVYPPEALTEEVIDDNDYIIGRYDNIVIDGRHWEKRGALQLENIVQMEYATGKRDKEKEEKIMRKFRNPFGIANYINHPPKGKEPNVANIAYDFPDDTPEEMQQYIPNVNIQKENWLHFRPDVIQKSVVVVTKKTLKDEELFMNYRFNPKNPYPDWYHQPDEEAAQRRWGEHTGGLLTSWISNRLR